MRSQTSSYVVQPLNKFLSRATDSMRLCSRAVVWSGLIVCAAEARADFSSGDSNSANNPVEPKLTLEYWNYYALSLNRLNGDAENGEGRVLIPFKVNGIQQVFHIDPQVVTAPAAASGPRTGLGDAQIYNFTLTKQDIGLPEKVTFGIGPLTPFRQTPAPISAQTVYRVVSEASSSHPRVGVFSASDRRRGNAHCVPDGRWRAASISYRRQAGFGGAFGKLSRSTG